MSIFSYVIILIANYNTPIYILIFDNSLIKKLTSILSMYPFMSIEQSKVTKHKSTDIALETYVGYCILNSVWCNLHLVNQRIVVRKWMGYVASFVISCGQLSDVNSSGTTGSRCSNLAYHVDICVAKCWEFLECNFYF